MTDWAWSIDGESFESIDGMRDIDAVAYAAVAAFHASKEGDDDHLDEETGEAVVMVGRLENAKPLSGYVRTLDVLAFANAIDVEACVDGRPSRIDNLEDAGHHAIESLTQKLRAAVDCWARENDLQSNWQVVVAPAQISFALADDEDETIANAWQAYEELKEGAQ